MTRQFPARADGEPKAQSFTSSKYHPANLSNSPNVFCPIFRPEPKILVESEPDVIPIEPIARHPHVQERLLERRGER
ncbi:hypothetical protein BC936DRAFT_144779 [Jimgerdemannia flammicorona]|uniref:Uncharacterized protein n=2 Tax=Jimgerdemannia flammicorona TaxID=994334 RepID=A0A433QK07_9FUNG|nr:hypothetical protein BC936DRAFT_144779 [Jimgerdemannia flammicorona]RUS30107.1 hypothetical protein BC938DRAFT_479842 [Jimgerdemannia flammicorona]